MDAESNELKFDEEVDIYRASNYLSTRPLLITKGKIVTLQWRKVGWHLFNQVFKDNQE